MKSILVAGIGNIFLGDDAFGVEVVQELAKRPQPTEVTVRDFGIRSYDLAYALSNGYEAVILVDATPRGELPGTVSLIELDISDLGEMDRECTDAHTLHPLAVLQMARTLGDVPGPIYLVGCEPACLIESDAGEFGLSEPVGAAVPSAVALIESFIAKLRDPEITEAGVVPA